MKPRQEFDPIVSVTALPVLGAALPSLSSETHTASVFVAASGRSCAVAAKAGAVPTLRDRLRRRYWRYELDMTHHPVVLRFVLPAKEEAFAFTATVTLLWMIQDPVEVALLGVRDLKPIIWTFLDQSLRGIGRQFGIEAIGEAEGEMRLSLEKTDGEIGFGLRLPMLAVNLRLDDTTERYLSERIATGRAGNLAGDQHDLARIRADNESQQAEWRGRLERAQAMHRRELDKAQANYTRDIERLTAEHEVKLKSQRLDFYRNALGGGSHDLLVLQLIENPGDIGAVLSMIDEGHAKHYDRSRAIMRDLLDEQMFNSADMDDLRQDTIGQLRTALSANAPQSMLLVEEVNERIGADTEKHARRIIQQTTT